MFRRAQPVVFAAILSLIPGAVMAQAVWQPPQPPTVTAERTSWYLAGEPITVNGELYYPAGAVQFFSRFQMVRSGSFNGIPLYIDPGFQPESLVYVPLSGERMQPYQRRQPGVLVGTTGTTPAASLPPVSDVAALTPQPVGTSGRVTAAAPAPRVTTLNPPTGLNRVWINFDGRRWFSAGKAIDYDPATLTRIGTYRGWAVYTRNGDATTIYVPAVPGKLSPYKAR